MAPKKKCEPNSAPKLNSVNGKIVKPKHVGPAKRPLYIRRSVRLNPFPFVFGTHSPDLQAMIGRKILSNFDPIQQLKLRAVSPMWDYNVRLGCREVREMVLNLVNAKKSPLELVTRIDLNMKEEELIPSTIDVLRKLYCNIENLHIIYDSMQDADKLFNILQHFTKVTTFTLIITKQITIENFLRRLFVTINDHLATLKTLNLLFSSQTNETFPELEVEQFTKTLSFLQEFSCSFKFENTTAFFELMGKNLPPHLPLHTLCVNSVFESSQIVPMFEHNPKLSQLIHFQLNIQSMDVLDGFVSHLAKLEYLFLYRLPVLIEGRFTIECIRAIGKLVHLRKLMIKNFQLMTINQLSESLFRIRFLRVMHKSFFENIEAEWHLRNGEHVQPIKVMYKPFVENFAKQFPNLEALAIKTDLSKISLEFKDEFVDMCKKEFMHLKKVDLFKLNVL